DGLFSRDTLAIPAGTPTVVASDFASAGLAQWSAGTWGIVSNDASHPSRYFADSPSGNYAANANNTFTFLTPIDLSIGVHAYALTTARWELEKNYDAVYLEGSLDGINWVFVAGGGTTPAWGGAGNDPQYRGTRWVWRPETVDLSGFTGFGHTAVRLRWRLVSSSSVQFDGYSFDSLRVET